MSGLTGVSRSRDGVQRICNVCKSEDRNLLRRCGQCRSVMYCGAVCQKADWSVHKIVCKKPTANENIQTVYGVSSGSEQPPQITTEQRQEIQQLIDLPLDSILDRGKTERLTKELGQKWFDKYKAQGGGSNAGKIAVQNMCDWIAFNTTDSPKDAKLRRQYVEYAWGSPFGSGIGDNNWKWSA